MDDFQPPAPPTGDVDIRLIRDLTAEVTACDDNTGIFNFDSGDECRETNSENAWSGAVTLTYTYEVPEPTAMALFGLGLAGLGLFRFRRRRQG